MKHDLKPAPILYPMPVLIVGTYAADGTPDAMNAAWGCAANYDKVALFLNPAHKTIENVLAAKAFTVGIADAKNLVPADYVGVVSANDVPNKLEKTGWHVSKSAHVNAPVIEELGLTLECELVSYDAETKYLVGKIVNIVADERVLTDGKVDPAKLDPISYDPANNKYLRMGEVVGSAFHDGAALK